MDVTIDDQSRAISGQNTILKLLRLDRVWTNYVESNSTVADGDKAALQSLTSQMSMLLDQTPELAQWIHSLVARDVPAFEAALSDAIKRAAPDSPEMQEHHRRLVDEHRAVTLIETAATQLAAQVKAEQQAIAEKVNQLSSGVSVKGDISETAVCALAGTTVGLSVAAAIATTNPLPLAGLVVGLGVGGASHCFE
ncbi:hypothetical protein [Mycobacterium sp. 050134]|uniref:hypothetical protein n=1 Tax=Mycobacterium sp. 050134 TaxID=3096111 RepID=UPI002ED8095B